MTVPIITIDGDSGAGKGTLAHALADHFGFHYLDSGAIYRMVAFAAQHHQWLDLPEEALLQKLEDVQFCFKRAGVAGGYHAFCDDMDVTALIRNSDIAHIASTLSAKPALRKQLLSVQKDFASPPGLVTDGRDMGTVVFPDAAVKIYLTANPKIRAERRYKQLKDSVKDVNLAEVEDNLQRRDNRDKTRQAAPLMAADDALIIDSTLLSIEEVFAKARDYCQSHGRMTS
jgi:cytidylate kinase